MAPIVIYEKCHIVLKLYNTHKSTPKRWISSQIVLWFIYVYESRFKSRKPPSQPLNYLWNYLINSFHHFFLQMFFVWRNLNFILSINKNLNIQKKKKNTYYGTSYRFQDSIGVPKFGYKFEIFTKYVFSYFFSPPKYHYS